MSDQEKGPRIRTKIDRIDAETDRIYFALTEKLRTGQMEIERFQSEALAFFRDRVRKGCFEELTRDAKEGEGQVFAMRRNIDDCRYSIEVYRLDAGAAVPPHCHHNVASTQILLEGRLHLREYDRLGWDEQDRLLIRKTSERELAPGDWFQASEWRNNLHWFEPVAGTALIFNSNVRGYERETFAIEAEKFGRLYVDPTTGVREDGVIACDLFDEDTANARFAGRRMDDFTVTPSP